MAVPESRPSGRYEEPPRTDKVWVLAADRERCRQLEESGYRLSSINGQLVFYEPLQDGVLRYPPVEVQVPPDHERRQRYIRMGNTPLEAYFNLDSGTASVAEGEE